MKEHVFGIWSNKYGGDFVETINISTPKCLLQNQSLYLHVFLTKHGQLINFEDKYYESNQNIIYDSFRLNKFVKKQKLSENKKEFEVINLWHPEITVNIIPNRKAVNSCSFFL